MRFYILSDLHLRAEVEAYKTSDRIKRLCSKIRQAADIGENILFIILGDIVDKGKELSFTTARDSLSLIQEELKDYAVKFEFVPGNHDLEKGSLSLFDQLTSLYGSKHTFESASVYSVVHDNVNFIYADSTLSRDYAAPGRLDLDAIRINVKHGLTNILFCHHALSHGHGDPHDVVEDSATVIAYLNAIGISYFFHGHVHDANVTIPEKGLVEIGCGSLSGGIDWLSSVFHQFLVGYIQNGRVALIERWIDTEDGHGDFALNELYPKPKSFSDPDGIGRISYASVSDYIPRWVSLYEDTNQSSLLRLMEQEKRLSLRGAVQKHKKILMLCDAGMGKSIELQNLAHELSNRFHTFLYLLENYSGQDIQELLPESYRQLPPNRIALLLDGYDELNSEFAKTFRNKIKQYTQDAPAVNIVISSRSNFCGNESRNESRTFPGFYVYVLEKLDEADLRKYLKSAGIDITLFWKCAYVKGVSDLAFNPFYLLRLASIYAKDNDLPPKNQLMDRLIAETFNVDDQKFSGELDERYVELFSSLESLAVAMQLMHRQSLDDRDEYQTLISTSGRELIKKSGLLKRESTGWKFSHNNFREYLAAKYLSRLPKDYVTPIFYNGTNIQPYWVNTLGYLTGFNLGWNLIEWLAENSPSALVKFEPDRLNEELRIEVFKRIFDKFETLRLHLNDDLCDTSELAHFVKSNEILSFFDYFDKCKDTSIAEYALEMCKDSRDVYLRSIAWRYLYNTLGAEYVANKILPVADEELLLEISGACKDISKEKLCKSMEREYAKTPSLQLQAHLITYGSGIAIGDYVKKVTNDKKPPEGNGVHIDGPTAAISSIRNPDFLPELEALLTTTFDSEFEDNTWHGLRNSLTKAFVNCGTVAYEKTIDAILRCRPSADVHEENYQYCNYTIEEIKYARKSSFDMPKTLLETKEFLGEVRKYY